MRLTSYENENLLITIEIWFGFDIVFVVASRENIHVGHPCYIRIHNNGDVWSPFLGLAQRKNIVYGLNFKINCFVLKSQCSLDVSTPFIHSFIFLVFLLFPTALRRSIYYIRVVIINCIDGWIVFDVRIRK